MRSFLLSAVVLLAACSSSPNASVSLGATELQFDPTELGSSSTKELEIDNRGDRPVTVTIRTDPPFSTGFDRATIPPNGAVRVPLTFTPTKSGAAASAIAVEVGKFRAMGTLRGEGRDPASCGVDAPACQRSVLTDAGCTTVPLPDGTPCETGCAVNGVCHAGSCEGINPACDDGNRCSVDGCNQFGCTHTPVVCPAPASKCQTSFCTEDAGCGIANLPDGTLCGSTTCGATDVCSSGVCTQLVSTTPNCILHTCDVPWTESCDGGVCIENPFPADGTIVGGVSLRFDDVLFASESGAVLRWDGSHLRECARLGAAGGIWASSDDDVWVGMTNGDLQHFDGQQWSTIAGTAGCSSVVGLGPNNVVCAGGGRLIHLVNGVKRAEINTDYTHKLAVSGNTVWALSSYGSLQKFSNDVLSFVVTANNPLDLGIAPNGDPVVAQNNYAFRVNSNGGVNNVPSPAPLVAVGRAGSLLLAMMNTGEFASYDGTSWRRESGGTGGKALPDDVFTASNASDIWAGTRYPPMLSHYDGLSWVRASCGVSDVNYLSVIATSPGGSALAFGNGYVLRRGTTQWERVGGATNTVRGVSFLSDSEAWLVSDYGRAYHLKDNSFTEQSTGLPPISLSGVFARGSTDVYATVYSWGLAYWDGSSWGKLVSYPGPGYTQSVTGNANHLYVAESGNPPTIWHHNGTSWTQMPPLDPVSCPNLVTKLKMNGAELYGLCGTSTPKIVHWNGTGWDVDGPNDQIVSYTVSSGSLVALGSQTVWVKKNNTWTAVPVPHGASISTWTDIAALPTGDVLIVGGSVIKRVALP